MAIIALSPRIFPALNPPNRVEASGRTSDSRSEDRTSRMDLPRVVEEEGLPPSDAVDVVNALLAALDDAELEALERLDDQSIESLARELQLRGVKRAHSNGFLQLVV